MAVTTTLRINSDQLQAQLPAGASFDVSQGAPWDLPTARSKTLSPVGTDDATLQAAVTAAAAAFIDYDANRTTIISAARNALSANRVYLALQNPTAAQTQAEVAALARQIDGLIRLAVGDFTATT